MSIFYVDASAWVKYYIDEPGSDWIERFWEKQRTCASSELGVVEVLAALVRRRPSITGSHAQILEDVEKQFQAFYRITLDPAIRSLCPALLKRHALRGADCVHLASAIHLRSVQDERVIVIASDDEFLAAAKAEDLEVLDPSNNPILPD